MLKFFHTTCERTLKACKFTSDTRACPLLLACKCNPEMQIMSKTSQRKSIGPLKCDSRIRRPKKRNCNVDATLTSGEPSGRHMSKKSQIQVQSPVQQPAQHRLSEFFPIQLAEASSWESRYARVQRRENSITALDIPERSKHNTGLNYSETKVFKDNEGLGNLTHLCSCLISLRDYDAEELGPLVYCEEAEAMGGLTFCMGVN